MSRFLVYISIFSPVPALLVGLFVRQKLGSSLFPILLLLACSFVCDLVSLVFGSLKISTIPIIQVYGLLEIILLVRFFSLHLPSYRQTITYALYGIVAFYLIDIFLITGIKQFNAYSKSGEAALMIALCVLYFYKIFKDETDIFIDSNPPFWFVIGILVYFSGAFFSFLLSTDILSTSPDWFYGSWVLHNSVNTVKNIIFTFALWQLRKS